jgi:hypothetical protein
LPWVTASVLEGWGLLGLAAVLLWRGRGAFFLIYLGTLFSMVSGKVVCPVSLSLFHVGWSSFTATYFFNLFFCGTVVCLHWVWRYQRWAAGRRAWSSAMHGAQSEGESAAAPVARTETRRRRPIATAVVMLALLLAVAMLWPLSYRRTLAVRGSLVQPSVLQWRWCDLRSAAGGLELRYARNQYVDSKVFADESTGRYLLEPADLSKPLDFNRGGLGFQFGYGYLPNFYSQTWGYDFVVPYWAIATLALGIGWRALTRRSPVPLPPDLEPPHGPPDG